MPVVTVAGQVGSGVPEIARLVADSLHIDYVHREITAKVAARLRCPEPDITAKEMPPTSLLGRIVNVLEHTGGYHPIMYFPARQVPLNDRRYLTELESVISELARSQSVVLHGLGSQFILRDYPGALHILLIAPLEVRAKRVMQSLKVDDETAKQEMSRLDNSHCEFIKRYFQAELENPAHYDLVTNTQHFDFEAASSIIVGALPFKDRSLGRQGKTA